MNFDSMTKKEMAALLKNTVARMQVNATMEEQQWIDEAWKQAGYSSRNAFMLEAALAKADGILDVSPDQAAEREERIDRTPPF